MSLRSRVSALAAKMPSGKRTPRLCVVTSEDPADLREAKLAEATRTGDPILDVEMYEAKGI